MASIEDLQGAVGRELEASDWFLIDQARVDSFAQTTLDFSPTHVDVEGSAPLGGTTAHGMLLLSLLPALASAHVDLPAGCTIGLNYGFDRVRFITPVRVGKRVRLRATLASFSKHNEVFWKKTLATTMDIEDEPRPAFYADWTIIYR